MTGPDHYHEAEEIINQVLTDGFDHTKYSYADLLAMAQVHATLAAAAASAIGTSSAEMRAWNGVAGTKDRG